MLFNSHEFIFLFLPLTLVGFYAFHWIGRPRWAWSYLTTASIFFYSYWNFIYAPIFYVSLVANLLLLTVLVYGHFGARGRKLAIVLGVCINLGGIAYFKYRVFVENTYRALVGMPLSEEIVFIPLGISFFTFQELACLIEAYKGGINAIDRKYFPLFISFFPQLIAGPIVLHDEFFPQLKDFRWREYLTDKFAVGLSVFIVGLFKKTVMADSLGDFADEFFNSLIGEPGLIAAWQGVLAYTFQLYFDFSGYSDMAVGLGALCGFRIPPNFESPYKAVSIQDFWRRWHMTLSRFLRDYLYIPLGGNRSGRWKVNRNLLVTMALGGLWHGANWTFVIWGTYHGVLLMVHRKVSQYPFRIGNAYLHLRLSQLVTFTLVVFGWAIFRSNSWAQAQLVVSAMMAGEVDIFSANPLCWVYLAGAFLVTAFFPNTGQVFSRLGRFQLMDAGISAPVAIRYPLLLAIGIGLMGVFAILSISVNSKFLYFQF